MVKEDFCLTNFSKSVASEQSVMPNLANKERSKKSSDYDLMRLP